MTSSSSSCRRGVTLADVLVTLLALAVLVALILPAIQQARESARRSVCENTLKQLGLAFHSYHDLNRAFPHGCVGNPKLPVNKRWSWYLCIGNYWGHYGTPNIDYECSWDDPTLRPLQLHTWTNAPLKEFDVPLYPVPMIKCPNGTQGMHSDGQPYTDYVGTAGIAPDAALQPRDNTRSGAWSYEECTSLSDIRDGLTNSLMAIETSRENGCWIAAGPATVREYVTTQDAIGRGRQFGGLHNGGSMALFADGHVGFLATDTASNVFSAAMTIAGSEDVSSSAFESR